MRGFLRAANLQPRNFGGSFCVWQYVVVCIDCEGGFSVCGVCVFHGFLDHMFDTSAGLHMEDEYLAI